MSITTLEGSDRPEEKKTIKQKLKKGISYLCCKKRINPQIQKFQSVKLDESIIRSKAGIVNTGNICFLSSIIQVLSHINQLQNYYISKSFQQEIGTASIETAISQSFSQLLKTLLQEEMVTPINFLKSLDVRASQFLDNQQHDAHQFLCYFLQILHQEINHQKSQRTSLQASVISEKKKQSSIIVDLFDGSLLSTVRCLKCNQVSTKQEIFNTLSLPIPKNKQPIKQVYFAFQSPKRFPIRILVKTEAHETLKDLKKLVLLSLAISTKMVFCQIKGNKINEILDQQNLVDSLHKGTIFAYQYSGFLNQKINIQVNIFKKPNNQVPTTYPRLLFVNHSTTYKEIHQLIYQKIKSHFPKLYQKPYNKFKEEPFYDLKFRKGKCCICNQESCLGCPFPYIKTPIGPIQNKEICIDLNFKQSCTQLTQSLNQCFQNPQNSKIATPQIRQASLQDCLRTFSSSQSLSMDNSWYCEQCKQNVSAQKHISVRVAPKYLIVHLKRFQQTARGRKKICTPLRYKVKEMVLEGVNGNQVYDLCGVVSHYGDYSYGHYTATCCDFGTDNWFKFNDHNVSLEENPHSTSAYLLFYRKRIQE